MAWSDVPLWEEAETECKHGNFQAAGASLLKGMSGTMPAAAAGAVLAVSRHSDVGFNEYDLGGHKLARAIEKGEHLDTSQTKRCKKLAERYATQAMTTVWGAGGSAGAKRLRRLFEGRDPWSGEALRWGDDDGSDEAVEVGGAADSSDEDEAEAEDEDSDSGSFIVPDESEAADEAESSEVEEEEEEEEEAPARRKHARRAGTRDKKRARTAARKLRYEEEEDEDSEDEDRDDWTPPRRRSAKRRHR